MKNLVLITLLLVMSVVPSFYGHVAAEPAFRKCAIMNFEKEYERSKAVFVGKVSRVEKEGSSKVVEFQVKKYWKGIDSRKISITVRENRRYQTQFKADGEFLVFAKSDDEGKLWDGRCSRSKDLAGYGGAVEEDLKKLGEAKSCISLEE